MTELRVLNLILWLAVIVYMAPGAYAAATGNGVRRGDPMRLGCLVTAIVMAGFNARWLLFPDSTTLWAMLYVLSAADAVYIAILARTYGRGSHV